MFMHARSASSVPSHPNEPTSRYDPKSTNWYFAEYQCNNRPRFIDHRVGRSVLLWPWLVFSIPSVVMANKAKQITNQIPGHPDSGMATAAVVVGWVGVVIGGLYLFMVIGFIFLFFFALDSGF